MKITYENRQARIDQVIRDLLDRRIAISLADVEYAIAQWRSGEGVVSDAHEACTRHTLRVRWTSGCIHSAVASGQAIRVLRDACDARLISEDEFIQLAGRHPREVSPAGSLVDSPSKRSVVESMLSVGAVTLYSDARRKDVTVPEDLRTPALALRFGYHLSPPIPDLVTDERGVSGTLTFSGVPYWCTLPWPAIFAVASETGQGNVCWPDDAPEGILSSPQGQAPGEQPGTPDSSPAPRPSTAGRHLRIVE